MKREPILLFFLLLVTLSQSASATLYDINFTGTVSTNQTNGTCPNNQNGPGLIICQYFAIGDTVNMTLRYDESTPSYNLNNNPNYRVHDNAFSSLSLATTSNTYSGYSGTATGQFGQFGQFMVRDLINYGYTFRLWESNDNPFAYDTANDMDLTPLDTDLTFSGDNALGDIVITSILINLTSLRSDLITSNQLPTSLSLSDFDNANNTNWGMTFKNGSGFGASIGINLTGLSVSAVASTQNPGSPIPTPTTLLLMIAGLIGFHRTLNSSTSI
ncbi:MAG: hypothetical protein OQL20_05795 [Sedimenticola sp.]|nr:hypothetical protein [Sedimenticola sp.]